LQTSLDEVSRTNKALHAEIVDGNARRKRRTPPTAPRACSWPT
jgi:hypothetical protein